MIINILALIQALPQFLTLMNRLADAVLRVTNWAQTNDLNKWITELEASVDQLEKSKTPAEKLSAAQALVGSIRKL